MASFASLSPVIGRAFAALLLDTIKNVPGAALGVTSKIHLSQDPTFNPQSSDDPADYTAGEADFSGYTSGGYAATWSAVLNNGTQMISLSASALPVVATASPQVENTIYGYWWENANGLILAERLPSGAQIAMATPGDYIDLLALFAVDLTPAIVA